MAFRAEDFSIVPEELLSTAIAYGSHLETEGFKVQVEPMELAQPSTPVFLAERGLTKVYVHVLRKVDLDEITDWTQYARTFQSDTRVRVVTPASDSLPTRTLTRLTNMQVGLVLVDGSELTEVLECADLTVNLSIPRLPPGTHEHLGDAWDLMRKGKWMEGYEEACQTLNTLAAKHLARKAGAGQVTFVTPSGKPKTLDPADLERSPLGQLGTYYSWVATPGTTESTVEGVIAAINDSRITVAHYKKDPSRQEELRRHFARNTFLVLNAVKLLI